MTVKIIVGNVHSRIVGHLPEVVQQELDNDLSYKLKGARFIPSVKEKRWDGVVRLYKRAEGQSFHTGLLAFVRDVFNKHGIEHVRIDRRQRPEQNLPHLKFLPPDGYEERDYQSFTIDKCNQYTRGIISACTGSGKTMMVTRLISEIKTYPFIYYVLTKDLMEQAHDTLSSCLNEPIGRIGDGKADFKKITVCTIQTAIRALSSEDSKFKISEYKFDDEDSWDEKGIESATKAEKIRRLIRLAKGIYFDETHHAAARTCRDVLTSSPEAYWRFGGSATPYREDKDEIMLQAMFGRKIVDINASYLIRKNYLVRPYIYFVPVGSTGAYHSFAKVYSESVSKNDDLNNHVASLANHMMSRDLSVLVLVKQYAHGNYLKKLIPDTPFLTGKMSTKARTRHINALRTRENRCMIATTLADEGLDIPTLDAVIMAGGGASATRVNQRIGRTLRKDPSRNKDKSIVISYEHNSRFLLKHSKKVRGLLKKEPEFEVRTSKGLESIQNEVDELLGVEPLNKSLFDL